MNLPPADVDLFYKLHGSLLAFANRELKILPAGIAPDQVRKQPLQAVARLRDACYEQPALNVNAIYSRLKEREGIIESLVGPGGQPQIRTSLARKAPAKPASDWRVAVDEILAQAEKMRRADTKLQGAAFGLLRAAASLAQATLLEQGAEDEATKRMKAVRAAVTKLEKLLYEDDWLSVE